MTSNARDKDVAEEAARESKLRKTWTENGRGRKTPEYACWNRIKERCTNPNIKNWHNYGGRGIKVCDRWLNSYEAFYADMGPRPSPKHTIDRYPNNDGDYEPGNCRWATMKEQSANTRTTCLLTFNGITMPKSNWAMKLGLNHNTLNYRLKHWTLEKALTTPRTHECYQKNVTKRSALP